MEKTKLLLVMDSYYPLRDGVLTVIEEFVKRPGTRFEITVLIPRSSNKRFKKVQTEVYKVSKRFKASIYPLPAFSRRNFKKIKRIVSEHDVVFAHGPSLVGVFVALHYAKKLGKKTVFYIHNTAWDFIDKYYSLRSTMSLFLKRFFVFVYNRWDLLLVPYKEVESELRKEGVKSNIAVSRLGVDIVRFSLPRSRSEWKRKLKLPDKKIITYVGRICNEKNTPVLLDALLRLNPDKYFLLMVGDGKEEIVKRFKEVRNCKVTGFVDNVEDYLKASDVFVMPSLTETTSLATLEAMATGVPVIVTKVGFMKKYVIKNHNGLFFARNSSTMLAIKIEKLIEDEVLYKKLSKNARKTVAYGFSWERSINRMKKLL